MPRPYTEGGMLSGNPLKILQADTWASFNVTHPRFLHAMPAPACLEGMLNEKVTGGTAAVRWLNYFATGGVRIVAKGKNPTDLNSIQEGKYFPSMSRWSYSSLFTHQHGGEAREMLRKLARRPGTVVIGSEQVANHVKRQKLGWTVYALPSDLYLKWEGATRDKHIAAMKEYARSSKGRVFLCAFDVICGIFFQYMWEVSQDNWYLTLGAALDGLIGSGSRSWINNPCTKLGSKCTMFRSSYHWDHWTLKNGGLIPHAAGAWKKSLPRCKRVKGQADVAFMKASSVKS